MPPKKIGRKTNKKKGNKSSRSSSATTPPTNSTAAHHNGAAATASASLPDMSGFERPNPIHPDDYPTVYQRYKNATKRFFAYMEKQARVVGAGIASDESSMSVNTLMIIADQMDSEGRTMDPMALKDLQLAIRVRSRVAKSLYGGGDSGHQHLLAVLIYCWTVLDKLPKEATKDYDVEPSSSSNQGNRFEVFQEDINDEEIDDEDSEIFPSYVPRPEPDPEPTSLEYLLNSDERNDAILFLLSLEENMVFVAQAYQVVCKHHRVNVDHGMSPSNIVATLIGAAVATNMCIQQVHRLEMELSLQYPHLSTPYRLLSTCVLPDITSDVASIMREHAAEKFMEKDLTIFLGDCMECTFRTASDPCNRAECILPEFCLEYKVDSRGEEKLREIVDMIRSMTVLEVPVANERSQNKDAFDASGRQSHSWLMNMPHISGGRSIHHTIRLLQMFGGVIQNTPANYDLVIHKGHFGPTPWVQGRSSNIAEDMDELLVSDILSPFVTMFREGILGRVKLPMMDDIAPLWMNLRDYVRHPEKAVSWSLAFTVHALLTSVLETEQFTDTIMSLSESAFHKYFEQLKLAMKDLQNEPDSPLLQDPVFRHNFFDFVLYLENLGLPADEKRAVWNPLYGGTILSYLTYAGNMAAGSSLVDIRSQLRIVMFLYHGLLLNGIIESGQIPFLDVMYSLFKNSRAVWDGELPRRGELVQRFFTCGGISMSGSKKLAQAAQGCFEGRRIDGVGPSLSRLSRKVFPIRPEDISNSYRRVCKHDFHDVVDKYYTTKQRKCFKHIDNYALVVRVNNTFDAIGDEQLLLSFNLVSIGIILDLFVCSLTRVMQWDPVIKSAMRINPSLNDHRVGSFNIFATYLLGALDFSLDPLDHEFFNVPLGRTASSFLSTFFMQYEYVNVAWFKADEPSIRFTQELESADHSMTR